MINFVIGLAIGAFVGVFLIALVSANKEHSNTPTLPNGAKYKYCVQSPCSNFKTVEQIKAEAYKEFAREVTEEIKKAYDNNSGVLREHLEKHKEKPNFEFVSAIQGKMNTLLGLDDFIDTLLKEMVGEEK